VAIFQITNITIPANTIAPIKPATTPKIFFSQISYIEKYGGIPIISTGSPHSLARLAKT
jgi:hypothetical protein